MSGASSGVGLSMPDELPYKVISQEPKLVQGPTGQFVQGYRITAQMKASGTSFVIDVPQSQYNYSTVLMLLSDAAAHVGAIDSIGQ